MLNHRNPFDLIGFQFQVEREIQPGGINLFSSQSFRRRMWAVFSLHFFNDLYSSFLPTLLPELIRHLSLSLGQAGFLNSLVGMIQLTAQPLSGYKADHSRKLYFIQAGPVCTALGACLLPVAPSYGFTLLFVGLFGIGSATFHPQGHGFVGKEVPKEKLSFFLALFSSVGTLGTALSPLCAVWLLEVFGTRGFPLAALPVLFLSLASRSLLKEGELSSKETMPSGFFKGIYTVLTLTYPILFLCLCRDVASTAISFFLPLWVTLHGGSVAMGGVALFAFTLTGLLATLLGGHLADRYGPFRVTLILLGVAPFFLLAATHLEGIASIVCFIAGGAVLSGNASVTTAMAQQKAPFSRSVASSLATGVSWGISNFCTFPIGVTADLLGLNQALTLVSLLPWFVFPFLLITKARRTFQDPQGQR